MPYISLLKALSSMFRIINLGGKLSSNIYEFMLDDNSTSQVITIIKTSLQQQKLPNFNRLNAPITYILDELICNIQQHAQTDRGYIYASYNNDTNDVELIVADSGISIYGSYVSSQKYLDLIGNSDACALSLAQNGYSTKNLPEAENRGYGISSNIKMVTEGLNGEFAVLSGNALSVHIVKNNKILALPNKIDFKGTMVIIKFPAMLPEDFNIYNYMN